MKLIVGLGNPGTEYAYTRHNMGWLSVDHMVQQLGLGRPQLKFRGEFWRDAEHGVMYLKPLTFMNLSGAAVGEAVAFYKMNPSDVLIIYDDLALPWGRLRLRAKGSAGGHNGLASVIGALGTIEIPRLRIGLGGLDNKSTSAEGVKIKINMVDRVLGHLTPTECEQLPAVLDNVESAINWWLTLDIQRAMTRVNAAPDVTRT